MAALGSHPISRINRLVPVAISYLLVTLMMVCLTATIIQLGQRLVTGWQADYYYLIAIFISLESLISWRVLSTTPTLSLEWLLQRGAEWVVMFLFIKACVIVGSGIDRFLADIPVLIKNFLPAFFTIEYMVALFFASLIWFLSGTFGQWISELEHDPDQLDMEREGYGLRDRDQIRKNLVAMVFTLGAGMLLVNAFLRLDIEGTRFSITPTPAIGWNLVAYFIFGLGLLGVARFTALRSRWYVQNIPIRANLATRWAVYCLAMLVLIGSVALLLPTRYSIGLLELLGNIITIIAGIIGLIELFILTPILFFFQWLSQLFRTTEEPLPPLQPVPIPAPPPSPSGAAFPWLEVLKSILFWGIFLAVIAFSIYHYLSQRSEILRGLENTSIFKWIFSLFRGLSLFFQKVNRDLNDSIRNRIQKIRRERQIRSILNRRSHGSRGMLDPRGEILATYLSMVEENETGDLPRRKDQTPNEYAHFLDDSLPSAQEDIHGLTDAFVEARYSRHEISKERASWTRRWWEHVRAAIHSRNKTRGPL